MHLSDSLGRGLELPYPYAFMRGTCARDNLLRGASIAEGDIAFAKIELSEFAGHAFEAHHHLRGAHSAAHVGPGAIERGVAEPVTLFSEATQRFASGEPRLDR